MNLDQDRVPDIYVSSDWHLGHDKLVELEHRPANFAESIRTGLQILRSGDQLINLGDVCLYRSGEDLARQFLSDLRSRFVSTLLVLGNHDNPSIAWSLKLGWDAVVKLAVLDYRGRTLTFSHEPLPSGVLDALGAHFNVHGHLHTPYGHRGNLIEDGRHILISAELMQYRPLTLDRLLRLGRTPVWETGKFVRLPPVLDAASVAIVY
jgi:calcineurin-like phosphoesterase family protein